MRLFLATLTIALVLPASTANADPTNHFGTFTISCGGHALVITSQPGASNVVTFDGQPSNSVSVLMGLTFTVDGDVVMEFHKPFVDRQDVTVCTSSEAPGELLVVETLLTPRRP